MRPSALWPKGKPRWADGYTAGKPLGNGEWLIVHPLALQRGRLSVMTEHNASVEHWCMDSELDALIAWIEWPRPPERWNRHQHRDGRQEHPDRLRSEHP
jgi:hypothetical protein